MLQLMLNMPDYIHIVFQVFNLLGEYHFVLFSLSLELLYLSLFRLQDSFSIYLFSSYLLLYLILNLLSFSDAVL